MLWLSGAAGWQGAFMLTALTSVTIPDSVTYIGEVPSPSRSNRLPACICRTSADTCPNCCQLLSHTSRMPHAQCGEGRVHVLVQWVSLVRRWLGVHYDGSLPRGTCTCIQQHVHVTLCVYPTWMCMCICCAAAGIYLALRSWHTWHRRSVWGASGFCVRAQVQWVALLCAEMAMCAC